MRLAQTGGWSILLWRGLFIFLALGVFAVRQKPRERQGATRAGSALLLAFTSIFFVMAVIHTTTANIVVVLSTAPLFAALLNLLAARHDQKHY